jgi:hypothetical protein
VTAVVRPMNPPKNANNPTMTKSQLPDTSHVVCGAQLEVHDGDRGEQATARNPALHPTTTNAPIIAEISRILRAHGDASLLIEDDALGSLVRSSIVHRIEGPIGHRQRGIDDALTVPNRGSSICTACDSGGRWSAAVGQGGGTGTSPDFSRG